MCKGAILPPRAPPKLVAEPLLEKPWVIQELGRAVASIAVVPHRTGPRVVKTVVARLGDISRFTVDAFFISKQWTSAVPLTMVIWTTAVVVGGG
jgi:hypothetical protein